ncbi:MAG: YceI family protein [Bacteroidales bacterium]|nr:YceI family protein [Bacteroidales bacterium]
MKKLNVILSSLIILFSLTAYSQSNDKLVSSKTHIKFFSHTPAEDIEANNYTSVSTLNKETGEVVFSVPMQGFDFKKALMQKHYNSDKYLDTKTFPKAKLKATITNFSEFDLSKDGSYEAVVEGELTIHGVTKAIKEKGTLTIKDNMVSAQSTFNVTLADYGVEFVKGKPSSNIAKTVEVTVLAEY